MSSEVVTGDDVREELSPYLGDVLRRQDDYEEIKEVVNLLSGQQVVADVVDNSALGQGYSEAWSTEKKLEIEESDYVGYNLELDLVEEDKVIDFRTARVLIKEVDEGINLIFPNEEMVGKRMILTIREE